MLGQPVLFFIFGNMHYSVINAVILLGTNKVLVFVVVVVNVRAKNFQRFYSMHFVGHY